MSAGFYWLASYPKSGNTWLRLALLSLCSGGIALDFATLGRFAPVASDREAFEAVLGLESADLTPAEILALRPRQYEEEARLANGPLLRKVHDAWIRVPTGEPLFPPSCTRGAVYLVRDPRDVAISFAHHNGMELDRAIAHLNRPDATLGAALQGGQQIGQRLLSWSGHVASWLDESGLSPLLLRYEAMLDDPAGSLAAAAAHLGIAAPADAIERAVAASRFERLQAEEDRVGFREKPLAAPRFFRRGIAGGWQTELSPAQAGAIEQAHGPMMARLGYL